MAKGIVGSGAGFDAPSVGRLGVRGPVPTHNPPAHQMKSAGLKVGTPLYIISPCHVQHAHVTVEDSSFASMRAISLLCLPCGHCIKLHSGADNLDSIHMQ